MALRPPEDGLEELTTEENLTQYKQRGMLHYLKDYMQYTIAIQSHRKLYKRWEAKMKQWITYTTHTLSLWI